jgi:fucose permease
VSSLGILLERRRQADASSTVIAIGLEFVVWFVPSLIGSALCFSLVGVAIGPMYPSCVMIITEVMPHDLHTGTIGFIACLGVVGSAIMPFITGAIADRVSLSYSIVLGSQAEAM